MKRCWLLLLCALILMALIVPVRQALMRQTGSSWQQESLTFFPENGNIKPLLMGFETTFAHYLWIRTILYFGGHRLSDRHYPWLIDMLDAITRLCPWFYPAYEFGGLMVPDVCNNPEAGRILLERGIAHLGDTRCNLGFYLGMIYFKYYDDRMLAAQCIARASFAKDAPRRKLIAMAQSFYTQEGGHNEALDFLIFALNSSENPQVRRYLSEKISELQKSVDDVR